MPGTRPSFVADADIHALVDGRIEADRRADTLRRLAGSPAARARVEAWQDQNDLLRSAFAGIEREPLPALLDLKAKSRLQCIPANDAPLVAPVPDVAPPSRRRRALAATATAVLICLGLGGSWVLLQSEIDAPIASAPLRGTVDATLAGLSTDALARPAAGVPVSGGTSLPTNEIPDLHAAGFGFAGAEPAKEPGSILFRYQNGADKIVVSVGRAVESEAAQSEPRRIGGAYVWHKRDKAFALAGTARPAKLRAIAVALLGKDAD